VDQVLLIVQQQPGDAKSIAKFAALNEVAGGDHRDPAPPQGRRVRQPHEGSAAAGREVSADDLPGRAVDEIPVVDPGRVAEIEAVDRRPPSGVRTRVLAGEDEERQRPRFVPLGGQQHGQFAKRQIAILPRELTKLADPEAEELVALAVFAWAGLEEPLQCRRARRLCERLQATKDGDRAQRFSPNPVQRPLARVPIIVAVTIQPPSRAATDPGSAPGTRGPAVALHFWPSGLVPIQFPPPGCPGAPGSGGPGAAVPKNVMFFPSDCAFPSQRRRPLTRTSSTRVNVSPS
jgi:hypothetical protein